MEKWEYSVSDQVKKLIGHVATSLYPRNRIFCAVCRTLQQINHYDGCNIWKTVHTKEIN